MALHVLCHAHQRKRTLSVLVAWVVAVAGACGPQLFTRAEGVAIMSIYVIALLSVLVGFGGAAVVFRRPRSAPASAVVVSPEDSPVTALDSSSDATMAAWLGDETVETLEEFALRKGAEVDRQHREATAEAVRVAEVVRVAYEARHATMYFEALTEDKERAELARKVAYLLTPAALADAKRQDEARARDIAAVLARSAVGSSSMRGSGMMGSMDVPFGSSWVGPGK